MVILNLVYLMKLAPKTVDKRKQLVYTVYIVKQLGGTEMAVKSVKVWKKRGEIRVYVKNDKGFESVEFVTGNNWNKAGSRKKQGKFGIKSHEWQEAEELAKVDDQWTNYNYQPRQPRSDSRNSYRCPDCHSPYCTGPNCDSNYPRRYK